jgi:antitoxin MazE
MNLQINRWGNSLALRLPLALVKNLGVAEGTSLTHRELGERLLALDEAGDVVQDRKALLERLRKLHAGMPVTMPVSKDEMSRY